MARRGSSACAPGPTNSCSSPSNAPSSATPWDAWSARRATDPPAKANWAKSTPSSAPRAAWEPPPWRFRHFLAIDRQKAMREHRAGPSIPGAVQHGRPEQRVEVTDVLANEVIQLGGGLGLPILIERGAVRGAPGLEAGDIADRRVEPDVEILARRIRHLDAKIWRIARDVPVLQSGFEPLAEFCAHRILQAAPGHIVPQHGLERPEFEKQVIRLAPHRLGAGDGRHRIDQIRRRLGRSTNLAAIAKLVG